MLTVMGSNGPSGYNIQRSLRFRASASAYLNRTPASAGNQRTWTISFWAKINPNGNNTVLSANNTWMRFGAGPADSNTVTVNLRGAGATNYFQISTPVYRDPSAWYHVVWAVDTTQATDTNRSKIYVNGVQVTSFSTANYPPQNQDTSVNLNAVVQYIGQQSSVYYYDGYMAEFNLIDGQALTPSSFGQTDAVTGAWIPKRYTGTYGTNGFYLPFTNTTSATTLAYDASGNGNDWTPNNISTTAGATYDSMTDVPTLTSATAANYCVLNPLFTNQIGVASGFTGNPPTITNANLTATAAGSSVQGSVIGSIGVSTGKWYFEYTPTAVNGTGDLVGFVTKFDGSLAFAGYRSTGNIYTNGSATSGYTTWTSGDVIGVALDIGGSTISGYKNGTLIATLSLTTAITDYCYPVIWFRNDAGAGSINFGQRPFSYTPPTGFKALNTFNLPTPTIQAGNKYMNISLYTGTNAAQNITNSGSMQPDFVWTKIRDTTGAHILIDSNRGNYKVLFSDTTGAEQTANAGTGITGFNSNGYSLGTDTSTSSTNNANGYSYVAWQWKAGAGTNTTNTDGSITSTVSVNPTAGFSVVGYTGNGTSGATVGHSLGVAPAMVITKPRSNAGSWWVYHQSLGANYVLELNSTNAQASYASVYNNTAPNSSVITLGNGDPNFNGGTQIAYCWAAIPGYSAFGSYTGNGSANGPFVYTGFRPRFILFKNASQAYAWWLYDTSRNTYNYLNTTLEPNSSDAEYQTSRKFLCLSNGFSIASSDAGFNTNGDTMIYAAFAENPFKYANAR